MRRIVMTVGDFEKHQILTEQFGRQIYGEAAQELIDLEKKLLSQTIPEAATHTVCIIDGINMFDAKELPV